MEVSAYYEKHPALFSQRRVYSLQEVDDRGHRRSRSRRCKKVLTGAKTFGDFVEHLKANNIKFRGAEAVRAAEQLPLRSVEQFAALKDGQAVFAATPTGARVIHLVARAASR